jgi:hypothetical protein
MFGHLVLQRLCSPLVPAYWLMVPIAFFLAMAISLFIRSVFDVLHPAPLGDDGQAGRNALLWAFIAGFASVIWAMLALLSWSGAQPPLKLVPLLIGGMGAAGLVLAARSALRRFIINAHRPTYQDDVDWGLLAGTSRRDFAPDDTLGLYIGALLIFAAFFLWQAGYGTSAGLAAQWC